MRININPEYEKLVPSPNIEDYNTLKESIKQNGLELPIIVNEEGIILDGHQRYKICSELKIEPKTEIKRIKDKLKEKTFVVEINLARRQLNDFQKAELGMVLLNIETEKALRRKSMAGSDIQIASNDAICLGKTIEIVAKKVGLSPKTFERAKKIIEKSPEKIKDKIRKGNLSISYAFKSIREKNKNNKPIPKGEFNVIYADPPYKYYLNLRGSPELHYDTMTTEKICSLKIPSSKDSILFLWSPSPKLKEALEIMDKWGFEYKTNMVWIKNKIGTGYYVRGKHELLLIGIKGKIGIPEESKRPASVIISNREIHSKKPEIVYKIIEKMYPEHKYLELFARNIRKNWEGWGLEYGN